MSEKFLTSLRDAVASRIESAALAENLIAPPGMILPTYDPEDLEDKIHCDVLVQLLTGQPANRQDMELTAPVDIVVQRRITEMSEVDNLITICERIPDLFTMQALTFPGYEAICLSFDIARAYDRDELRINRIFAAVMQLEFTAYPVEDGE